MNTEDSPQVAPPAEEPRTLLTRCPHCETRFRVTAEQMDVADGIVRCGACARVFDAAANEITAVEPAATGSTLEEHYIRELLAQDDVSEAPSGDDAPPAGAPETTPAPGGHEVALPLLPLPLPVELHRGHGQDASRARWLWTLGVVLAALALVLQYLWYRRDTLAQDPDWRVHYERVCAIAGCELPAWRDLRRIRSDALAVRPASDRPGVLQIDAVLTNYAPFPQALPGLELLFTDLQGAPVASRVFLPGEYLVPGARATLTMPPRKPLRVHFEILDPGEQATNYELRLKELPAAG